ncbi:MAG: GNAT family N-acetyltransferase [Bacteroidales bacterium]
MTESRDRSKVVETDRLILRKMTEDDATFMLRLLNEPSFIQYIGDRGVRTVEHARRYVIDGPMASYARFGFGLYVVTLRDTRTPIGICGLLKRDSLDDVDVGFAFIPEYVGQGYGIESAAAVIDHARNGLGLNRVVAITNPDNERSIRLLEKLGFAFERMTRLSADAPEVKLYGRSL